MTEAPRHLEEPFEPAVVHYKATDFIYEPENGFKAILLGIPEVAEATGEDFWKSGGKRRILLGDGITQLDLNWEPGDGLERTVLDVGLNRPKGFKLAFLTAVDPEHSNGEHGKRSSFLYGGLEEGQRMEPVMEDTPTGSERIEELKKEIKTFIPSEK